MIVNRNDPRQWRATYLVTACTACLAAHYFFFSGVLCFGDEFFLGPIDQEAKAKTVIISGLAVTAGQFLVISDVE